MVEIHLRARIILNVDDSKSPVKEPLNVIVHRTKQSQKDQRVLVKEGRAALYTGVDIRFTSLGVFTFIYLIKNYEKYCNILTLLQSCRPKLTSSTSLHVLSQVLPVTP